jgi:hypothetical protein
MNETQHDGARMQAELAQVRAALRAVQAPPVDEAALRAQFRSARQCVDSGTASTGKGSWRVHFAAAAVVVLATGAALAAVLVRVERPEPVPLAAESPQPELTPVSAFQPLMNSPSFASPSYSVVRVRIPLSAFALVPGTQNDGTIEADLLVGEDGLARGIRFAEADASLASVSDR